MEESIQNMKSLRNIGPACAKQLVEVGIDTPGKLKELGAREALFKIFQKKGISCVHACYLYALHGAIHDCAWKDLPESKKKEYKDYTKALRESVGI